MSGVEVVGLILGVLPLFISAAEHYRDGKSFVEKAVRMERFANRYHDELAHHRTLLSLYIKAVIGRTSLSAKVQADLVEQPDGAIWQNEDVVKQICTELGGAHQRFLDVLTRICKTLHKQVKTGDLKSVSSEEETIQQLRALSLDAAQATSDQAKKDKIWDRIRFSWKSPERAAIITELKLCNEMLEQLSIAADRAKPYERKQQTRRVHAAFQHRDQVGRIFDIIQNACRCQSSQPRGVGLRLQVCADGDDCPLESKFQMILIDSHDAICELHARMMKGSADEPPKRKKVRMIAPGSSSKISPQDVLTKNMKILEDICKEVRNAHACNGSIQLFVDSKEKVYCSATQNKSPTPRPPTSHELLSLSEVLSNLSIYNRKRWLHKEKSILAIILAYSLLQLHDSPWSRTEWDCESIAFVNSGMSTRSGLKADACFGLRSPYTRSQIVAAPTSMNGKSAASPAKRTHRNARLHALGVMLLELYLGRSIEADVAASDSKDYGMEAQRLLSEHADDIDMTRGYHDAIRFCLFPHPSHSSGSFSFEDKDFREIFYMEVIAKLEDNLMSRFEIDEKDLDQLLSTG